MQYSSWSLRREAHRVTIISLDLLAAVLGCKYTSPAYIQFFCPPIPQTAFMFGINSIQVHNLALGLNIYRKNNLPV